MRSIEATIYTGIVVACVLLLIVTGYFLHGLARKNRAYFDVYARKNIELLEKERLRISGDIHDEVTPVVMICRVQLEEMIRAKDLNWSWLERIEKDLQQVVDSLRSIVLSLNMMPLKKGLGTAIMDHIRTCQDVYPVQIALHYDVIVEPGDEIKQQVFRIVQELVHNALKHADATYMSLAIRTINSSLLIEFTDNGRGFDTTDAKNRGIGLSTLRERAILLNGLINCRTSPGKGTHYYFEIPIEKKHV